MQQIIIYICSIILAILLQSVNKGETDDSVDYDFDGGTGESWIR